MALPRGGEIISCNIRWLLFIALLSSAIIFPALGFSASYESGGGGETVSISSWMDLDPSSILREETSMRGDSLGQSVYLSGLNSNRKDQVLSCKSGPSSYIAVSSSQGSESLAMAGKISLSGKSLDADQNSAITGRGSVHLEMARDKDRLLQDAELEDGGMSTAQGMAAFGGELNAYGGISLQGSGTLNALARDDLCSNSFQAATKSDGPAQGTIKGAVLTSIGSPAITLEAISATGDCVKFESSASNPQGSYASSSEDNCVDEPLHKEQGALVADGLMSIVWKAGGSGTITPIDEVWASTDGTKSISNRISGYGDRWNISRDATYGTDYVYLTQDLINQGQNGSSYLDACLLAGARNNGEMLYAYNDLHAKGTVYGTQMAGADASKAYVSQSLYLTGSIQGNTAASSQPSNDYSWVIPLASNAQNLKIDATASASNSAGTETYHRTMAALDIQGMADSMAAQSWSNYLNGYVSHASGSFSQPGWGDLCTSAKTVKAAMSDLELTSNSTEAMAYTYTKNASGIRSALGISVREAGKASKVSKLETHLYSHAYPESDHHSQGEYVSTDSTGLSGVGMELTLGRWDESTGSGKVAYNSKSTYQSFRATDISVLGPGGYSWDKLWQVPQRSATPITAVPWGIKTMYANSGLTRTSGGQGVDVAVIDAGADTLCQDLVMRMEDYADSRGPGEYGGQNSDPYGHGTHVSGTIVADGGFDGEGIWGMAPEADLHIYKVDFTIPDVARGIYRSTDLGADIISISLGDWMNSPNATDSQWNAAIDYAVANKALVVAAAGNGLSSDPTLIYPARYSNVVGVGAVDQNGYARWRSSPGYNDGDGIIGPGEVMFGAPGYDILSTTPSWSNIMGYSPYYGTSSGTSMATPHITGVAAKLLSESLCNGADARDILGTMQGYARNNDVKYVRVTSDASGYRDRAASYANTLSGAPAKYYGSISSFMDGTIHLLKILDGDDCLTGLGIPRLPSGTA